MTNKCPKCGSDDWDHANVGLIGAIVCTNCGRLSAGNIYMMKEHKTTMTESEFEAKFDNGDFDCAFAEFLFDRYDASNEHKLEALWHDEGAYSDFKDLMVTEPSTMLQDTYFGGVNPLDSFPSIRGNEQ